MDNNELLERVDLPVENTQSSHSKLGDTGVGCFVGILFVIIAGSIIGSQNNFFSIIMFFASLIYILAIVIAFLKGKKYIGIGLLIVLVIPAIVLGGCLFLFKL